MGRLHAVLPGGGGNTRRLDVLRVVAESIEECRRGQRVDQPRNAAAERVDLLHGGAAEGVSRASRDADPVLDVVDGLLERQRTERVAHSDALPERLVCLSVEAVL